MAQYNNIIVKRGDYGSHVVEIQRALKAQGFWPIHVPFSKNFGPTTDKYVKKFQAHHKLVIDGWVGGTTLDYLADGKKGGKVLEIKIGSQFDEKWKDVIIPGAHFPDKPISWNTRVRMSKEMHVEYIPTMELVMADCPKGFRLLVTIMAHKEGFRQGTRSYRHNNPGNIGNTDSGKNHTCDTLEEGILRQRQYVEKIVAGNHRAYPMGKRKVIQPYFSPEIAKHTKLYGMSPYVPGYDFIFDGSLEQFVKIYATGARAGNGYLSMILSYFKKNGIHITPKSRLQDIIKIEG